MDRPNQTLPDTKTTPSPISIPPARTVTVLIDGKPLPLTREQEALIRSWASGPI